jgi:hypothetical protein
LSSSSTLTAIAKKHDAAAQAHFLDLCELVGYP